MVHAHYVVMLCCVLSGSNADAGENSDYLNLIRRGRAEYRAGHFVASETLILAALRALQQSDERERATTLAELGNVYMSEDELSKAERVYTESLAIHKRLSDKDGTALALRNLGTIYSLQRRDDDALRVLQQALKLTKTSPPANAGLTAHVANSLGIAYFRQGRIGKAEKFFNEALRLVTTSKVPFNIGELLNNLGAVSYEQHKFQKAEDLLTQALKISETETGPSHPDLTNTLSSLGVLYTETGRYTEAEAQYQRALTILEPAKMDFDTRIARLLHALSGTYTKAGRKAEADTVLAQAAVIARRNVSQHPDMAAIMERYSGLLQAQGKTNEAEAFRGEAKRARAAAGLVIRAHNAF